MTSSNRAYVDDALQRLADLLGARPSDMKLDASKSSLTGVPDVFQGRAGHLRFALAVKDSGDALAAANAIRALRAVASPRRVPVFVAPYLQPAARVACGDAGVSWFDLSGNATISGPGLRIVVLGEPNRLVRRGRPSSVFASKSSRIARALLVEEPMLQRDLARVTKLGDGYVSRTVKRLRDSGLVSKDDDGLVFIPDRALMLEAWRDAYDFSKHNIVRFHAAARSGEEVLHRLARAFTDERMTHAMTGLGAAWLWTGFAGFRTTTVYVADRPAPALLESLGLHPASDDGAIWVVVPNDGGVFDGASVRQGVRCVHPLQAWLDLKGHPERAAEAASSLRPLLTGGRP